MLCCLPLIVFIHNTSETPSQLNAERMEYVSELGCLLSVSKQIEAQCFLSNAWESSLFNHFLEIIDNWNRTWFSTFTVYDCSRM